jgi:hypothetical protein
MKITKIIIVKEEEEEEEEKRHPSIKIEINK